MCTVELMGQRDSKISHVDVIKITEMRLEVERKAPEKKMDNHSFLFSLIFYSLCPITSKVSLNCPK